jgi:hypothetical protein
MDFDLEAGHKGWRNEVDGIDHHRHFLELLVGALVIYEAQNDVLDDQDNVEEDRIAPGVALRISLGQLHEVQASTDDHDVGDRVLLYLLHRGAPTSSHQVKDAVDDGRLTNHNKYFHYLLRKTGYVNRRSRHIPRTREVIERFLYFFKRLRRWDHQKPLLNAVLIRPTPKIKRKERPNDGSRGENGNE